MKKSISIITLLTILGILSYFILGTEILIGIVVVSALLSGLGLIVLNRALR